ncbi:uncharacterized protein LOC124635227 isoform X4 [Helicoverpa zea]|uniref:uncharacterized protein LOC124635227 isoform X4 n=1 Tax=Helicoverpa zea TaxID=7113 RepID=UPI001F57DE41|nr:uncharacterized protein LOC124635227 isoform X4 [Helicoverpa zea]
MVLRNNDRRSNGQFQPRRSDKRIFKFKKNNGRWKNTGDQEVFSPFVRAWFQFTVIISAAFREEKTCRSEYSSSVVIIAGSSQHSSRAEPKNIASKLRRRSGQLECLSAKPDEQFTEREQFEAIYYKQLASARALLTQHRTQLANKRTKWTDSDGVLEEGAMVVLKEQQTPPLMWPLGRIVRLIAGRDGISRVADVKTKRGIVRRAYNTICPLPV